MSGSEEQAQSSRWRRVAGHGSLALRLLLLTVPLVAAYPLFGGLAAAAYGPQAWGSAALAAGLCGLGAALALAAMHWLRGPQQALYAMLIGMFLRMGLPLVASVTLALRFLR